MSINSSINDDKSHIDECNMVHDNENQVIQVNHKNDYYIDIEFGNKLFHLQAKAIKYQYLMACLSTLGGAYHLTNNPKVALQIAKKQQILGKQIGSTDIIFKSMIYQAINYKLLGYSDKSNKMIDKCNAIVDSYKSNSIDSYNNMLEFLNASISWMKMKERHNDNNDNDNNINK